MSISSQNPLLGRASFCVESPECGLDSYYAENRHCLETEHPGVTHLESYRPLQVLGGEHLQHSRRRERRGTKGGQ